MDFNVSQIIDFQRCELDWKYKWVDKRIPRSWGPTYFQVGIWWHRLMEHYFKSFDIVHGWHENPVSTAAVKACADMVSMQLEGDLLGADTEEFNEDCSKLLALFDNHWVLRFPPSKIESVEKPLRKRLPFSEHYLIGIPDTVVWIHGRRWHLQHKTASATTNMKLYVDLAERSLHELAYAWLLEDGSPYGGTYLNLIRKISAKQILAAPRSAFVQELIPLSEAQITLAIHDIRSLTDRMARIASGELEAVDNREADSNRFGNSKSAYFDVKTGRADLWDDALFMNHVSRYEGVEFSEPTESTGHLKGCRCPDCDPAFNEEPPNADPLPS